MDNHMWQKRKYSANVLVTIILKREIKMTERDDCDDIIRM